MGTNLPFVYRSVIHQIATIFLSVFDWAAAISCWQLKIWGAICFLVVSLSEVVGFCGLADYFSNQNLLHLIVLNAMAIGLYLALLVKGNDNRMNRVSERHS